MSMLHLPPGVGFVWTPEQAIDEGAYRRMLREGAGRREDGANRWYLFRARLTVPRGARHVELLATADSRYRLALDGAWIGRGPARAAPRFQLVDRYEVTDAASAGEHTLAALVHVYGVDTGWYEVARGDWQRVFGDGAFLGAALIDGTPAPLEWRVVRASAWRQDTPRIGWGHGFVEDIAMQALPGGWTEPDFDDRAWPLARAQYAGGGPDDRAGGWMEMRPFPTLHERGLPHFFEEDRPTSTIVAQAGQRPDASLPIDRRPFDESWTDLPDGAVVALAEGGWRITTQPGTDVTLVLDCGRLHAGFPFVEIEAQGGEIVELVAAETIPGHLRPADAEPRPQRRTRLDLAQMIRATARPGRRRIEKFDWAGFRFLQLIVRDAPAGLLVTRIGSRAIEWPLAQEARFACSDPELTRLWRVARDTVFHCMHDAWNSDIGREQRQWVGDATVEALVGHAAFGPEAAALTRHTLRQAAQSQREDGLLQMFAPGDHHRDGVVIPDFSLHWVLTLAYHLLYTGDVALADALYPTLERLLAWFLDRRDAAGLIADPPGWHFIEWAALDRRGYALTLNAMLAGALDATARIAATIGRRGGPDYAASAAEIAAALRTLHWDEARGLFVDSVDPASRTRHARVSQHGNAAMLLWGGLDNIRAAAIAAAISDPKSLKLTAVPPIVPHGEPFDEAVDIVRANSFFAHFVYTALARAGRFDLALAQMRADYLPMLATGTDTLWESFAPDASLCHGFSAGPLWQLTSFTLGIQPASPGCARLTIAPQPADLDWAEGTLLTGFGPVALAWRRTGAGLSLTLTLPEGVTAEPLAPPGFATYAGGALGPGEHSIHFAASPR